MYELYLYETRSKLWELVDQIPGLNGRGYEEVIAKAKGRENLTAEDIAVLLSCAGNNEKREDVIHAAAEIKEYYYGNKVKKIIPLSISNFCVNDCIYCGYRRGSRIPRKRLSFDEFKTELDFVFDKGFRHIELVISEDPFFDAELLSKYVDYAVRRIEATGTGGITLNIAPLSIDGYRKLKDAGLYGLYMWQESYDPGIYKKFHPERTPKADFVNRLTAYERMIEGGIKSYGVGILFGLGNPHFEVLNIVEHCNFLEREFGYIPSMFGIPRLQEAPYSKVSRPSIPVSDNLLKTIVAIYRLSFPATNVFVNSRETIEMQLALLRSGGDVVVFECSTYPGGYTSEAKSGQFVHHAFNSKIEVPKIEREGFTLVGTYDINYSSSIRRKLLNANVDV